MCVQRWWSEYHLARELDGTFDFNASPEGFCRGPAGCSRPSANSGDGALPARLRTLLGQVTRSSRRSSALGGGLTRSREGCTPPQQIERDAKRPIRVRARPKLIQEANLP